MNIIIPMAGMGKRMRPHTLTVPKPLVPIAGKPIVERLVEDIVKVCPSEVENIGFVIGKNFGEDVEKDLIQIASRTGAKGHIFYQEEALGTAHAIYCAKEILEGKTVVAFADTLFKADFTLDIEQDGIIWVKEVEDPSAFGVVQLDDQKRIMAFVEKPKSFVSNLAIIGIYYFKKGEDLRQEISTLIDNKIMDSGEYQLTRVLENLTNSGTKFYPGTVQEWLDCGNKTATVNTNHRYLEYIKDEKDLVDPTAQIINSVIIPPVYIGRQARIINSVVGPHVSVGHRTEITDARVENSIIQKDSEINRAILKDSMIGNHASFDGKSKTMSVGDFNTIAE
ncbi:sugar phosphate nucleotidyltransferase [Persicobacter psychrovividus]|uniref:Nucleotidyltransferase n=1 Tax=Persicobacter psychrovividus TaxID=387638 RepID=A0ABM7VAL5_9BACT|nr:nucleotidyltransferase [Persicobacter psychrovividus]